MRNIEGKLRPAKNILRKTTQCVIAIPLRQRASRVLAIASRNRELSFQFVRSVCSELTREVRFGGTPKPARETRALPTRICLRHFQRITNVMPDVRAHRTRSTNKSASRTHNDFARCDQHASFYPRGDARQRESGESARAARARRPDHSWEHISSVC